MCAKGYKHIFYVIAESDVVITCILAFSGSKL